MGTKPGAMAKNASEMVTLVKETFPGFQLSSYRALLDRAGNFVKASVVICETGDALKTIDLKLNEDGTISVSSFNGHAHEDLSTTKFFAAAFRGTFFKILHAGITGLSSTNLFDLQENTWVVFEQPPKALVNFDKK